MNSPSRGYTVSKVILYHYVISLDHIMYIMIQFGLENAQSANETYEVPAHCVLIQQTLRQVLRVSVLRLIGRVFYVRIEINYD